MEGGGRREQDVPPRENGIFKDTVSPREARGLGVAGAASGQGAPRLRAHTRLPGAVWSSPMSSQAAPKLLKVTEQSTRMINRDKRLVPAPCPKGRCGFAPPGSQGRG